MVRGIVRGEGRCQGAGHWSWPGLRESEAEPRPERGSPGPMAVTSASSHQSPGAGLMMVTTECHRDPYLVSLDLRESTQWLHHRPDRLRPPHDVWSHRHVRLHSDLCLWEQLHRSLYCKITSRGWLGLRGYRRTFHDR